MSARTCAACDCELDANAIEVVIGGKTVAVCCGECARVLKEAHAAAKAASLVPLRDRRAPGLRHHARISGREDAA